MTLAIILLVFFDLAIVFLLKFSLKDVKISNALREKSVPPTWKDQGDDRWDNTSFSRVAGMLGAIVLSVFFWMLGNVIIWQLLVSPTQVATTVNDTYRYFLFGTAMFAPYAFNQLASIFK